MRRLLLISLLSTCLAAHAEDTPVGYVKTVSGEAYVTSGKSKVRAVLGTPVFQGSQLKTSAKSSLGVVFKDETVMSFGPDTDLTVDEYIYAPNQGKLKLGTKLAKGTLNYVSGAIAKLRPDAVSVATPSGIIGVRGTQFLAKVQEQ